MRTLIVVRHAKSSWDAADTTDHDRPLNKRGEKDAPAMAKRLRKRGIGINAFVSSTAKRARTTAQYFAAEYKINKQDVALEEKLYLATSETIYDVIATLSDKHTTIAIFGHNPGITNFVNTLCGVHVDDMPTCAIYAVTANANTWALFKNADKQFLFFDHPKQV